MREGAAATPEDPVATCRIAAILTVFNRKQLTLACLESLARQGTSSGVNIIPYIVDDGSSDGTGDAVASAFPEAVLLSGDGMLFWNGGMRWAFGRAMSDGYDFYLWLNDDTALDDGAVEQLLATYYNVAGDDPKAIVVGATREPDSGELSYGGVRRPDRWRPLHFERVPVAEVPQAVDTMNGNCVLIAHVVAERLGNIDAAYLQKLGDFDYGLRASAAGIPIWVTPGTIGTCATHPPRLTAEQSLAAEIRRLWSHKELPVGPWKTFARRWGGSLWPAYFLSPYARRAAQLMVGRAADGRAH